MIGVCCGYRVIIAAIYFVSISCPSEERERKCATKLVKEGGMLGRLSPTIWKWKREVPRERNKPTKSKREVL